MCSICGRQSAPDRNVGCGRAATVTGRRASRRCAAAISSRSSTMSASQSGCTGIEPSEHAARIGSVRPSRFGDSGRAQAFQQSRRPRRVTEDSCKDQRAAPPACPIFQFADPDHDWVVVGARAEDVLRRRRRRSGVEVDLQFVRFCALASARHGETCRAAGHADESERSDGAAERLPTARAANTTHEPHDSCGNESLPERTD